MNEQRASIPYLPGFLPQKLNPVNEQEINSSTSQNDHNFPDDSFFEMLMKSQVIIKKMVTSAKDPCL